MTSEVSLVISLLLLGMAGLTVMKAPTVFLWRVAVVAGEYGHFLAALPAGLGAWVLEENGGMLSGIDGLTLGACGIAAGLLLKPWIQARRLARRLPGALTREFGEVDLGRGALAVGGVFERIGTARRESRVLMSTGVELALDFYRAEGSVAAPCVVVVHGGGWDGGERTQMAELNARLARSGFAVAAVTYRLAPAHVWPAQRDDVRAAIAYLKTHDKELGIDAGRFVLLGRSAGGQLAEAVAYGDNDPAVRGVIALYAPADLNFAWYETKERDVLNCYLLMRQLTGGTPETKADVFAEASPFGYARAVPTLLMHGRKDPLVWHRQSERLAERLKAAGVPCVFLDLPWATHAFDFNPRGPGGQLSAFAIEWFVKAVTR